MGTVPDETPLIDTPPENDTQPTVPSDVPRISTDVFLFSGALIRRYVHNFVDLVEQNCRTSAVTLVLTTYGGEGSAAYLLTRCLKRHYEHMTVCVFGPCKSAGTIAVLGADEIVISDRGELGPLDVQFPKKDELGLPCSGLDIFDALEALRDHAFMMFEHSFLEIKKRSRGTITTRTAADIATAMTVGILAPISQQIDPLRLGEMRRALEIAVDYGCRLTRNSSAVNSSAVNKLAHGYPSHDFVINREEAQDLFGANVVRAPNPTEIGLEGMLRLATETEVGQDCVRFPYTYDELAFVAYVEPEETPDDSTQETDLRNGGQIIPPAESARGEDDLEEIAEDSAPADETIRD